MPGKRLVPTAALALALAPALALTGCAATAATSTSVSDAAAKPLAAVNTAGTAATHSVHLVAYTPNDGPDVTAIVTGAIGDYGEGVSVYPNGTVDPEHNSEFELRLSRGTFRLAEAALDQKFISAFLHAFPTDAATCSGTVSVTGTLPIVPGSGTGAYRGVRGSFTVSMTVDEVDARGADCNGTGAFLSQVIVITGPGTVSFG